MWDSAFQNPLGIAGSKEGQMPDAQQEAFLSAARQRYEYCIRLAQVFKSKEGKQILQIWRQNTIEAAAWSPSLAQQTSMEAACAHAYAREGQNAFVRDVEMCIQVAHECKTLDDFCAKINQLGTVNKL